MEIIIRTEQLNNTIMETQIINQGDFALKYFKNCDVYSLLYKDRPIWGGEFKGLFDMELRDYIFEREPDPKKASEFITKLYNWGFSQQGTLEKMLDEEYK